MIRWTRTLMVACLVQAVFALGARAADSLDQLLEETRNARALEAKANAAREAEFLANRDKQAALLADAKAKRDAAEKRSQQLSAAFDANELKLKNHAASAAHATQSARADTRTPGRGRYTDRAKG